jgi:hypothetical protein
MSGDMLYFVTLCSPEFVSEGETEIKESLNECPNDADTGASDTATVAGLFSGSADG